MKRSVLIALTIMLALASQPTMAFADTTVPLTTQPLATTTAGGITTSPVISPVVDASGQPVNPGTLPGSTFYWLSSLIQKLQVALTFDPVQKATLEENQALQKLAAARELMEKGKPELAQQSLSEYTQKNQDAQQFLTQLKDPNSDTAQILQKAMAQTNASNIQVLSGLLEKLPPQAAEKLAVNIVKSMEKAVDKMTDEQKKEVETHIQETAKHINQDNPDAQVTEALAQFQTSLGLKGTAQNGDNNGENGDNNGENKNLHKEDVKQPGQKIDDEKKAEVLKQEKNQETDKAKEQKEQQEQDNEDNSKTQVKQAVPAQAPTVKSTPSPVSKDHSDAGRNNDGKGDNKDKNEN